MNIRQLVVVVFGSLAAVASAQRATPVQVLHPAGAANDRFGQSVAIDGDTMVVGSALDDIGANVDQGSAHVYRWTGNTWLFEATLAGAGVAGGDQFGSSVAISRDTIVVGVPFDDIGLVGTNQGSAYVFTRSGTTWTQQAQLFASGGAASDQFGNSVSIDGETVLVGASRDDVSGKTDQGSAYVFTRRGTTWTQQAQLIAADGLASDVFANSVSLSGDTAVIGAIFDDVGAVLNQGSAYVFTRSGTTWTQEAQLVMAGGLASDQFGAAVSVFGDTAVVGADLDDVGANANQGSAVVFTRSGTTWTQQAQLSSADGAADDVFGRTVAIFGDTVMVSALGDDIGANANQGSVHIFARSGTTWTLQAQVTAPDAAANDQYGGAVALSGDLAVVSAMLDDQGANSDQGSAWVISRVGSKWLAPDFQLIAADGAASDFFGNAIAISGDTAVVGVASADVGANANQGAAYIFVRSGLSWSQQAKLVASDGAASDSFGTSVGITGNTVIVGARLDDVGANVDQGSAYVFLRTGTAWAQQAKLTASDGAASDGFGRAVDFTSGIAGDIAIVGAPSDDVGTNTDQGSAYVFSRSGTTWTQQAKVVASDGESGDIFGTSVAVSGDTAVVGSMFDDVGANAAAGSVYVYRQSGTLWPEQTQITASDGAASDLFGRSVGVNNGTIIVGANGRDIGANSNQGAAYVFTGSGPNWSQQAQLTAIGGSAGDSFGFAVAISNNTVIVGAPNDDVVNSDQGSAYIFTRSGTTWTQQTQLVVPGVTSTEIFFGDAVAIDGTIALSSLARDTIGSNSTQGSVFAFLDPAADPLIVRNESTGVA
ncbi:MAG: FG-GAP repeat protein, partial [Phycisphaerales bacterium]